MLKISSICGFTAGILAGFSILMECAFQPGNCPLVNNFGAMGAVITFTVCFFMIGFFGALYSIVTQALILFSRSFTSKYSIIGLISSTLIFATILSLFLQAPPVGLLLVWIVAVYSSMLLIFIIPR